MSTHVSTPSSREERQARQAVDRSARSREPSWPPEAALAAHVAELLPGCTLVGSESLRPDTGTGATAKAAGYGAPRRLRVRTALGHSLSLALRTATPDAFGHDRRADRAEAMLLDFDTFGLLPRHVAPLDVGVVGSDGQLRSVADADEFFVLTTWAEGVPYAKDLRRIAREGEAGPGDVRRAEALAEYLARLHTPLTDTLGVWARSVRDVLGHGEGVFGMTDTYPPDTPAAPPERLQRLEALCLEARWRARHRPARLHRIHGDFHPFNVVFAEDEGFELLDASRGSAGDPADDVTALAVNYLFFPRSLAPGTWARGFRPLWAAFFARYLAESGDAGVLDAAPLYLAWRTLVVCHPRFYPALPEDARDALLGFAERCLQEGRLRVEDAEALFP